MAAEPSAILAFASALTLILVVAHALGAAADRLGFTPVVGELVTGLVLGPSLLGAVAPAATSLFLPLDDRLAAFAFLGLVLIVVMAGAEVDRATVRRHVAPTLAIAAGASIVPFLGGFALGWLLPAAYLADPGRRVAFALFLATALSISALPVAARVLVDLDAMDRAVGQLTLTVAVTIDAAGWVALTVVSDVACVGRPSPALIGQTLLVLGAFVLVVGTIGRRAVDGLLAVAARARSPALTGFSVVVIVGFAAASGALALGLEAVVGAFLAGVLVGPRLDADAARAFQIVTLGLFAPLFFATAGLRADLTGLLAPGAVAVALVTLAVAVLGKALGVVAGAALTDLTRAETACLAIGLNARGAMEIVVAAVGLATGVLTPLMYAVVILVAVVTSVMTPPLLRRALSRLPSDADSPERSRS